MYMWIMDTQIDIVNVDNGNTDGHADTRTWSGVVIRATIGGRNVQP